SCWNQLNHLYELHPLAIMDDAAGRYEEALAGYQRGAARCVAASRPSACSARPLPSHASADDGRCSSAACPDERGQRWTLHPAERAARVTAFGTSRVVGREYAGGVACPVLLVRCWCARRWRAPSEQGQVGVNHRRLAERQLHPRLFA